VGIMYGYARVSREDQDLALQLDALRAAGVHTANLIQDKVSGAKERPALPAGQRWMNCGPSGTTLI
jgi:DNA invertase Pin-like site-specific DNA recombinase